MERRFFKLGRNWPEGYASISLKNVGVEPVSHLSVYKGACDINFVKSYGMRRFSPGFIPDFLPNNLGWSIVSPRVRERILGACGPDGLALTPIADILPPNAPKAIHAYSLISTPLVFDCIDLTDPDIKWFNESRKLVKSCKTLQLVNSSIPVGALLFSVTRFPALHVVAEPLFVSLSGEDVTGVYFDECVVV